MSRLVIFGVSNLLGNIMDCAMALGHEVTQIVQNTPEAVRPRTRSAAERIAAVDPPPKLIGLADFVPGRSGSEVYALGTTARGRSALVRELEVRFGIRVLATLIHPTAYVSPLARIGDGIYIGPLSTAEAGAEIGDHVHVSASATIGHDSVIEPYVCVRQSSSVGGCVVVGRGAVINAGACVLPELAIGPDAIIGAGAVVVRDVKPRAVMAGVPARVLRYQPRTDPSPVPA